LEPQEIRNALGTFLFRGDDIFKKVSSLSGGETARIQLLKLMLGQDNLLLLDEPTNHLDISSREQLEDALCDYDGTLLIVTHDRYFINRIADKILILTQDGIETFSGDWDDYLKELTERNEKSHEVKEENKPSQNEYLLAKERKSNLNKARSDLSKIERRIAEIEENIASLETELASPDVMSDYVKSEELAKLLDNNNLELEALYEKWELAEELIERLSGED